MSAWDTIADIARGVAPTLAGIIGGPAAGGATKLLMSAFGGDSEDPEDLLAKMQQDPEAIAKLQKLEYDHKEELQRLALEGERVAMKREENQLEAQTQSQQTINETMRVEYKNNVYWRRAVGWAFAITVVLYPVFIFASVWWSDIPAGDMKQILVAMKEYWYVVGIVLGVGVHHAGRQARNVSGEKDGMVAGAIKAIKGDK